MDEQMNPTPRPENPRRKRRTQEQIIKENYLPVIIAGVALLLILIFIIGSIVRAVSVRKAEKEASEAAYSSSVAQSEAWDAEVIDILKRVEAMLADYDYIGAVKTIEGFSGDISKYGDLSAKYTECVSLRDNAVAWDDPNDVVNLSFHPLVADAERAFKQSKTRDRNNRDYVSVDEFKKILQQMFENGYVLVSMDDLVEVTTDTAGNVLFNTKTIYLPQGKTPFMLTETNVNYYLSLIDGDKDGFGDQNGMGIANKLVLDESGNIQAEMVDSEGNTVVGAYDLVPILEQFIEENPSFSYKGARATLAVSGYDGLFGYRTNPGAVDTLGETAYAKEVENCKKLINALRNKGYTIACYTYGNSSYGSLSATEIQAELNKWTSEVTPILGEVDTLVLAKKSDISDGNSYSGTKYETLRDFGFQYFMGFSSAGGSWADITNEYFRQGRVLVMGSTMKYNPGWFEGMFKVDSVLDSNRGAIPKPA